MEHFNTQLDDLRQDDVQYASVTKGEELVQLVTNIIFTILWRGKQGKTRKEALSSLYTHQGQAIASINLLALNNKLYTSHACFKRKLTELCIQAILSDLKEKHQVTSEMVHLARQMMMVVLDDHEDFTKNVSEPLLYGILGILDGFVVFQEGQSDGEWSEMAKMAFDILFVWYENSQDLEF